MLKYRNNKNKKEYNIILLDVVNATNDQAPPQTCPQTMVVYQNGPKVYARETIEFYQKFTKIEDPKEPALCQNALITVPAYLATI